MKKWKKLEEKKKRNKKIEEKVGKSINQSDLF
jgi:hypothetical protein